MASLASLTRPVQGPARLGISGHHHHHHRHDQSGSLAMSSQQPAEGSYACSLAMYRRSLTLDAEDPDATLAVVCETATGQPLRDLAPGGLNELLSSLDVHASCFGMGNAATDGGVTACARNG